MSIDRQRLNPERRIESRLSAEQQSAVSRLEIELEEEASPGAARLQNYTHVEVGQKGQPGYAEGLASGGLFYEGALIEVQKRLRFYPGVWLGARFAPGIAVPTSAGRTFLPGMYFQSQFVPGIAANTVFGYGSDSFVPGLAVDTRAKPGKAIFASIQSYLSGG